MPLMPIRTQRREARETLSKNIRFLMKQHGIVERQLADRSKVSQKGLNLILNKTSSATLDSMDKIATSFGLEVWQLTDPRLPEFYPSLKHQLPKDIQIKKVRGES